MIEHLKQETFDLLMEIFFEEEATDSPKVNEVNQHISRKNVSTFFVEICELKQTMS